MPTALVRRALPYLAVAAFVFALMAAQGSSTTLSVEPASTGCLPARAHAGGTTVETIATADGLRQYLLHVPPSYNGVDRAPVVLNFHGATGTAASQEWYSGFSARADQPDGGFVVVYPQGSTLGLPFAHYNAAELPEPEPDDVAFVDAVLDAVEAGLCIDANRVYATGFSNGAMMSVRLACSLSDRIAAVGLVAGAYYPPVGLDYNPAEACPDARPVPVIAFHGTADPTIPFAGGVSPVTPAFGLTFRLPIDSATGDDVMEAWAAHDGCTSGRQESQVAAAVRLITYDGCGDGAVVQLYAVDGGGHVWFGAFGLGDVDATELLWDFFQSHSLDGSPLPDTDGDTTPDPYDPDNDNDGCADEAELQTAIGSEITGGRRDPNNPWDFYDTDGDQVVDLDDIFDVAFAFGLETGSRGGGPYDERFDRSGPAPGADSWGMRAPDGSIDLFTDILGVAAQFGHNCQAAQ